MISIALRYNESFSPPCGTIAAHQEIIDKLGYAWFGKIGGAIAEETIRIMLSEHKPKILLYNSDKTTKHWAYISNIRSGTEFPVEGVPEYYAKQSKTFGTWFKVVRFTAATKEEIEKCTLLSNGKAFSKVAYNRINSYFVICCENAGEGA